MPTPVTLDAELELLARARRAVVATEERLARIAGGGADALTDEYIAALTAHTIDQLQQELVVFGRIDDDQPWRVGIFGIDDGGDQLVIDWRAPFATGFYQATFDDARGLARRVSYVGCIDDLFVEEFTTGEVLGSSPLLAELARERGATMRTAVATLQAEQDRLVRLPPEARLVLRGGPGTGKTVVGLHRAAWLVYNDRRVSADRILVVGPSDRFLRFVAAVLPTLGESRVLQTTFDRLLGPSVPAGADERWLGILDRFERSLLRPGPLRIGQRTVPADEVTTLLGRLHGQALCWRDGRRAFVDVLTRRVGLPRVEVQRAASEIWPACTARQAWAKLRRRATLVGLGVDDDLVERWLAAEGDGALEDEVRARFEGVPARYSHVILDEAQDATLFQLRAVMRRAEGVTLVGDDAQRSNPDGLGLTAAAELLGVVPDVLDTAYRTSAEIAEWLNAHAEASGMDTVTLVGIRPTGRPVRELAGVDPVGTADEMARRWSSVATITAGSVWDHKGVEYDAVVVDARGMHPAEVYLAASRAAHELVVIR